MSKDNIPSYSDIYRYSSVLGLFGFFLCCLVTLGCTSTATEVKLKLCTAERGKPLPPECFPKGSQYGGEAIPPSK